MAKSKNSMPTPDRRRRSSAPLVEGQGVTTEHLHFSTQMLRRLGEELNPHTDQGILELVRNAYDADATKCVVELVNTQSAGGTIRISDDGEGMTADAIRKGWLVLGASEKVRIAETARKRFPIGNKGIGRLAALRMGRAASLTTCPVQEDALEHRVEINWDRFDDASVVDEVPLELKTGPRAEASTQGTVVEINQLRAKLTKSDVKRLARALILLADPFRDEEAAGPASDFRPVLKAKEFKDLERLVARGYREEADYCLRATLDSTGRASAVVTSYSGEELFRATHQDISTGKGNPTYSCPEAVFELWWFVLKGGNFSPRSVTLTQVREWLTEFGGVHLYHRGMRVSPYSDYDWLDMNLRRVRSPELRPSTNNSIGRLAVPDKASRLKPKTDRVGFVEDTPFQDLRRFASDALEWFADQMLRRREENRGNQKERAARKARRARKNLDKAVGSIPDGARDQVQQAIEDYERATRKEANTLREDLQLYRTLGTVGTTAAAFAHQAKNPLVHIASSAGTLEDSIAEANIGEMGALTGLAEGIRRNAESLLAFAKVTLGLLQHEKRRRAEVSVHAAVGDIVTLLEPYIALRQTEVRLSLKAASDRVLASKAALESILTNLLINALKVFEKQPPGQRIIAIRTRNVRQQAKKERNFIQLTVLDNGPGITGINVDDIWLPGKTTTVEGTGLGLTIVRDVVCELGGKVGAVARGELGGAEIIVQLPLRGGD